MATSTSAVAVYSLSGLPTSGGSFALGTEVDSTATTLGNASGKADPVGTTGYTETDTTDFPSGLTYEGNIYNSTGTAIGIVGYNGTSYFAIFTTAPTGTSFGFLAGAATFKVVGSGAVTYTCFVAGTMIATPEGEVAVEALKAGDMVALANGAAAPITWLGIQTVSTLFADPLRANPIRVKAGALADCVPSRDLLLSPDHALLVDGILAQAGALVNGVSIVRETDVPVSFTYYHVEVADHALILAENTPAETFIDNADRMNFDNWHEHPGDAALVEMELPRAKAARQVPPATRARLLARGDELFGVKTAAAA